MTRLLPTALATLALLTSSCSIDRANRNPAPPMHPLAKNVQTADDLNHALRIVIEDFRADSGTIHTVGSDGHLHLAAASDGLPPVVLQTIQVVPIGKGMAGLAAQRREPVTICNIQTDSSGDVRPGAKATGLEGAIVVPMIDPAGKVAGTLGIANRAERTFTKDEEQLLLECGRVLARRWPVK